jgi:adenylate cyclase class IV
MAKSHAKAIEVEFRALVSEADHARIKKFLDTHAKTLRHQEQASYYFHDSGKAFKLVHDKGQEQVRAAYKSKNITDAGHADEFEISIDPSQELAAVKMFKGLLGLDKVIYDEQVRTDYDYKRVEIALKWSEGWGHHLEFEVVVGLDSEIKAAEVLIQEVADELGVKLMTDQEVTDLVASIHEKLENDEYKVAGYR